MTSESARNRFQIPLAFLLVIVVMSNPARAWGPHPEITQAAINTLSPDDALVKRLGPEMGKLPVYCWMADERQTLIVRTGDTFYADDYLLFPGVTKHADHLCPFVKATYVPHFRRALQALRTETPINAARWIGSLTHFVEDTGSPPHAGEISGIVHSHMENWVDAKKITIADYVPQSFGDTDETAEKGFLQRMDGLIEFSKARAARCKADVVAGNRAAVEPVVLESALETSRVLADLLHTLGLLAEKVPAGGDVRGHVARSSGLGRLDALPPKIILLSTLYSTVADGNGNFSLEHVAVGKYRLACMAPGGLFDIRDIEVKPAGDTKQPTIEIPANNDGGGLVRNPHFKLNWVSDGSPDGWYAVAKSARDEDGWQGEWLPLEMGQEYRLAIRWKPGSTEGDVIVRMKKGLSSMLPIVTGPPIARPTEEQRFTATPQKGDWVQIYIRTTAKPADIIEYIDLLKVRTAP
jgi:hypothetical protein